MQKLNLTVIIFLIVFSITTGTCLAQGKVVADWQSGYFYYVDGTKKVRLCRAFGRGAERRTEITEKNDFALILLPYEDENFITQYAVIAQNKVLP